MLLAIARSHRFLRWDNGWACIIRRCNAASSGRWLWAVDGADDRPRPGKEPTITPEAKAWLCRWRAVMPKELGYPHELGRRGCWRAPCARARGGGGHDQCLRRNLSKARCARISRPRGRQAEYRCVVPNLERRGCRVSSRRWRRFCASNREVQILKKARCPGEERRKNLGKPVTIVFLRRRSRESRRSQPQHPPDLPRCWHLTQRVARDMSTSAMATISLLAGN